jgi:hypothetical protein
VLRILNLTHSLCSSLIEDLKTYDATLSIAGSSKGPTTPGTGPLGAMLDHAMEEMFVPWLEGTRYLESENKNLVELYAGLLSRFTRYHASLSSPQVCRTDGIGNGTQGQAQFTAQQGRASTLVLVHYCLVLFDSSNGSCSHFEIRQSLHIR